MNTLTFVYLNMVNGQFTGADYELYSGYWQAYLRKNGIAARQYINTSPCTADELAADIIGSCDNRVAFAVNEYNYYITKVIAARVRRMSAHIEIIAAGTVAGYISEKLRGDFPADAFCTGNAFSQLLAIARQPAFSDYGELPSVNVPAAEIPHPYSAGVIPAREICGTGLLASRGCAGKCSFCSYDDEVLLFSPESVADELRFIYRQLGRQDITIYFYDECFGINEKNALRLCRAIAEAGVPYRFFCWCRLDMLSDELIEAFAGAGFPTILAGLESASCSVLGDLGKLLRGMTPEEFLRLLPERRAYAKSKGVELMVSVNFGLDGETTANAAETLEYLERHDIGNASVNFTTIFPKSRMYGRVSGDPERVSESPTKLPLRTFYPGVNMELISKNRALTTNRMVVEIRERAMRELAVDFCCNIKRHGEGIGPRLDFFTTPETMSSHERLILGKSCLVCRVDSLKRGRLFCDERKPLKYELDAYDENLRAAYESDVYIENQLFYRCDGGSFNIIMNNISGTGMYRFRYIGNSLSEKIKVLENLLSADGSFAELPTDRLNELIFDDMGVFLRDAGGRLSPSEERYTGDDIEEFHSKTGASSDIPELASAIIFAYKNQAFFGGGKLIRVYFSRALKGVSGIISRETVLICSNTAAILYDTRRKTLMPLTQEEIPLLTEGGPTETARYEGLRKRTEHYMVPQQ